MVFAITDYNTRQELEDAIRRETGGNTTFFARDVHKITGTSENLKRLFLDGNSLVLGVTVEVTEEE